AELEIQADASRAVSHGWEIRPYQIVSLLEMKRYYGEKFWRLSKTLQGMSAAAEFNPSDPRVHDKFDDDLTTRLDTYLTTTLETCRDIGLDVSALHIERTHRQVVERYCTLKQFSDNLKQLLERIEDEMSLVLLLHVPKNTADYYEKPNPFGEVVTNNFPSA